MGHFLLAMLHCQRVTNHCITYCNWPWKCQRFKTGCAVPKRFCSHCHRYRSTCATRQRSSFVESATFLLDAWRCQTWSYEQLGECCIVLVVSAQSHFSASDFGVHTAASIKGSEATWKSSLLSRLEAEWSCSRHPRCSFARKMLARVGKLCQRNGATQAWRFHPYNLAHHGTSVFFFPCSQLTQEEVRAYGAAREQRKREEMEQERRRRHRTQKEQLGGFVAGRYWALVCWQSVCVYIYILTDWNLEPRFGNFPYPEKVPGTTRSDLGKID